VHFLFAISFIQWWRGQALNLEYNIRFFLKGEVSLIFLPNMPASPGFTFKYKYTPLGCWNKKYRK
jgi:hypothetical protein